MAAPSARMRLTVEVLPLTADNAHGPYRAQAVAAFKGRKFALPVRLEDTFEKVWAQIEQRYKNNYLDPQQAAAFTIKKLQDAYDCDLDLGDTVSAIFEGETNPSMRTIKVVPAFVNRDFSVPPTSNLRPNHAQKRRVETTDEHANKRQRVEQQHQRDDTQGGFDPSSDQPIPTTESERSGDDTAEEGRANGASSSHHARRSHTGGSLVLLHDALTGQAEFGPAVKAESPGPSTPLAPTFKKPSAPASKKASPHKQQPTKSRSKTAHGPSREIDVHPAVEDEVGIHEGSAEAATQSAPILPSSQEVNSEIAAINQSPRLTSEPSQATPPPVQTKRRDIYDVPSSPEFMIDSIRSKTKKTYSRSPRTIGTIQKEVDLLNNSRVFAAQAQNNQNSENPAPNSLSKKARAFQWPKSDEIQSTPQEQAASTSRQGSRAESANRNADMTTDFLDSATQGLQASPQTPSGGASVREARPGSLKRPSRKVLLSTPLCPKRGVNFSPEGTPENSTRSRADSDLHQSIASTTCSPELKAKQRDPEIRARLDRLKRQRRSSPMVVIAQSSRRNSTISNTDSRSAGEAPATNKVTKNIPESASQPEEMLSANITSAKVEESPSVDNAQLSVQPPPSRIKTLKSPIPLPENVRHQMLNGAAAAAKVGLSDAADVFKKPGLKPSSMKSHKRARNDSLERRGSGSSDRRSTPLQTDVPVPNNGVLSGTEGASRRLSGSSNASRTSIRTEVPLPPNVRSSSSISRVQKPLLPNGISATVKKSAPTQVSIPTNQPDQAPKKETPKPTSAVAPATAAKTVSPKSTSIPTDDHNANEAIVISSREPTSSELSDSEEEEQQVHSETIAPKNVDDELLSNSKASVKSTSPKTVAAGKEKHDNQRQGKNGGTLDRPLHDNEPLEKSSLWTSQAWSFAGLTQSTDAVDKPAEDNPVQAGAPVPSQPIMETAVESGSKSRSASPSVSTRSSPAVTRRPARFLSHSPTPQASESESDSDETSVAASKANTPPNVEEKAEASDSDSSSDSDESDTGDEDTEMPDISAEPAPISSTGANGHHIPSSPPRLANKLNSTPIVPETSQPSQSQTKTRAIHRTPVPLPAPSQIRSSQSVSAQAASRRPTARYTGFRSLREQLAEAQTTPTAAQNKPYDPRTTSLKKLADRAKSGIVMGNDDDSSEEESSSSSSDSE